MVCAFQGWNDAGDAASSAVSFLASSLGARRFAQIDAEEFYDFQSNRPTIALGEHEQREIRWPGVEIFEAQRAARAARPRARAGRRAVDALARASAPTWWTWRRRWACRSSSRSARCSATCRTRARW